jgi:hypothetical protein
LLDVGLAPIVPKEEKAGKSGAKKYKEGLISLPQHLHDFCYLHLREARGIGDPFGNVLFGHD